MPEPSANRSFLSHERHPGDLVFALVFLLVALFLLSRLGSETKWVNNTKLVAQPAFWPTVSLACMSAFALLYFLGSLVSARSPGRGRELALWGRSIEFALWFMLYVWLVPKTGYLPSTIIFIAMLMLRLGYREKKIILTAVAIGIAIVVIFKGLLEVKIPGGQIYQYLPDAIRNFMLLYL
jgi:hypothetical protein